MRGDFTGQTALLQISDGRLGITQLPQIIGLGGIQRLRIARYLGFATRRFDLLARAALFFGNRHSHRGGKRAYRLGEISARVLHQEGDGAAVRAATKTVIELLGRADGKRRAFFVMKGA